MNDCYVFNLRTMLAIRILILRSFPVFRTLRGGTFGPPKSTQKPARGPAPMCPRLSAEHMATPDCQPS